MSPACTSHHRHLPPGSPGGPTTTELCWDPCTSILPHSLRALGKPKHLPLDTCPITPTTTAVGLLLPSLVGEQGVGEAKARGDDTALAPAPRQRGGRGGSCPPHCSPPGDWGHGLGRPSPNPVSNPPWAPAAAAAPLPRATALPGRGQRKEGPEGRQPGRGRLVPAVPGGHPRSPVPVTAGSPCRGRGGGCSGGVPLGARCRGSVLPGHRGDADPPSPSPGAPRPRVLRRPGGSRRDRPRCPRPAGTPGPAGAGARARLPSRSSGSPGSGHWPPSPAVPRPPTAAGYRRSPCPSTAGTGALGTPAGHGATRGHGDGRGRERRSGTAALTWARRAAPGAGAGAAAASELRLPPPLATASDTPPAPAQRSRSAPRPARPGPRAAAPPGPPRPPPAPPSRAVHRQGGEAGRSWAKPGRSWAKPGGTWPDPGGHIQGRQDTGGHGQIQEDTCKTQADQAGHSQGRWDTGRTRPDPGRTQAWKAGHRQGMARCRLGRGRTRSPGRPGRHSSAPAPPAPKPPPQSQLSERGPSPSSSSTATTWCPLGPFLPPARHSPPPSLSPAPQALGGEPRGPTSPHWPLHSSQPPALTVGPSTKLGEGFRQWMLPEMPPLKAEAAAGFSVLYLHHLPKPFLEPFGCPGSCHASPSILCWQPGCPRDLRDMETGMGPWMTQELQGWAGARDASGAPPQATASPPPACFPTASCGACRLRVRALHQESDPLCVCPPPPAVLIWGG